VTLNRVQSLFDNPVYGLHGEREGSSEASPEALDVILRVSLCHASTGDSSSEAAAVLAKRTGLPLEWLQDFLNLAEGPEGSSRNSCDGIGDTRGLVAVSFSLAAFPPEPLLHAEPFRRAYLDSVHVPLLPVKLPSSPTAPSPLVSWLVPVFNAPDEWLSDMWSGIKAQSGMGPGSWELVIVDDHSDSKETLDWLAQLDGQPQVHVVRTEAQHGVGGALNAGWRACNGEFIARLDADDIAEVDRLQRQLAYMASHPSVAIVGGGFRTFRVSSELKSQAGGQRHRMPCHPLLARWRMLFACSLAHPTVTMRKAEVCGDDPYPEGEEAEDHCCWLGLPLHVQFANIADVVTNLRRHSGSRSASAALAIRRSSYGAVRRFLLDRCNLVTSLTDDDMDLLWGRSRAAASAEQAQRVSQALDAAEAFFSQAGRGQ